MIIKCIEIRDDGTCIAAIAIKMSPENVVPVEGEIRNTKIYS